MKAGKYPEILDKSWPAEKLEYINLCPYCKSFNRKLAYSGVQDWSFYCAAGKWDYWDCKNCGSLYLDPRPTQDSIAAAYSIYYTHKKDNFNKFFVNIKSNLRNTLYYSWYGVKIKPLYKIPRVISGFLGLIDKRRVAEPFVQLQLASLHGGDVIDVGCGNGANLDFAAQIGWKTFGIEIDPNAVSEAQMRGHQVIVGSYVALREVKQKFDCVICSHVLEHVYDPLELIKLISTVLKPGGVLLLVLPNAASMVRSFFGASWRGLEAPRHLSIPDYFYLRKILEGFGFKIISEGVPGTESLRESMKIDAKRKNVSLSKLRKNCVMSRFYKTDSQSMDTIKLVCLLEKS